MLRDRLIVGILGAIIAVSLMLFSNSLVFGIIVSVIALIGLTEMYSAFGFFKKNIPLTIFGYLGGIGILFINNTLAYKYLNFSSVFLSDIEIVIAAYIILLLVYMVVAHKKTGFADISNCLFATIYVCWFFSYLILLRNLDGGKFLIWIPIIIAWLSDTMAYTFGRLFGKHKLIPEVSPKKTVEGAIGGVIGGVVFMLIYGIVCKNAFDKSVNWMNIVLIGGLGAVLSQFGDLAASWIKREQGIKDYGNLLPGHGGVMDRFDSVIIISPFVYYFVMKFPVIISTFLY